MKYLILFVLIHCSFISPAQNPFHDAIAIRKYVKNDTLVTNDPEPYRILNNYLAEPLLVFNVKTIIDEYKDPETPNFNPFLDVIIPEFGGGADVNALASKKTNLLSSLGGIAIPNEILLGVTDWIVKRTKQELSIYFFEHFYDELRKYPDLKTVFPQTYRALMVLGDEIYNYQRYLTTFRAAFQNDVRQLTDNFPTIIDNHPEFFDKHPELAATLRSGFYVAGALEDQIHPGDILKDYPTEYLDPLHPNWKGSLMTLKLISASLRDTIGETEIDSVYWVSSKKVKELAKDKVAFRIYIGLLYQLARKDYDNIPFETMNTPTSLVAILNEMAPKFDSVYTQYSGFITHFSEKSNKLNRLIKDHRAIEDDSTSFQLYFNYYNATIDLLEHSTAISKLPFINKYLPDLTEELEPFFDVVHTSSDLFLNVRQHSYTSAVTNAVHIYDVVKASPGAIDAADNSLTEAERDTALSFAHAKSNLLQYGTFLAAIADAEEPEEVQRIIESFALPPGSARIKRQSAFNVSLNAYCGLFVGNEVIKEVDTHQGFEVNSFGLTAPIGVTISQGYSYLPWPISEIPLFHTNAGWGSSWYITFIDLGAVAAYRFSNDEVEQVPTVQLGDIFSPGLFWSLGIPKSPLSFTLGAQVGPNLRKVNDTTNDYSNNTYTRFSASFCVDLPILNLYTKAK